MTDTNGILLLNKPAGVTSFKALGRVKRILKETSGCKVKVGHTGTLDKFAEGLLVVLTGKFTRLNPVFTAFDKVYEAEIKFGETTDTLDPEGTITETCSPPDIETIKNKTKQFRGEISQRPPVFSAVHVNGERAYKQALRGELTELPARDIIIHQFEILEWTAPVLKCRIHCSKGTYIRSIARDLGHACGSCAHLVGLKRLSVGPFSAEDSINDDDFQPANDLITGKEVFKQLSAFDEELFRITEVHSQFVPKIFNGVALADDFFIKVPEADGRYAVFSEGDFVACMNKEDGKYSYIFVAAG